jgi:hypothetical protein
MRTATLEQKSPYLIDDACALGHEAFAHAMQCLQI